MSRCYGIDLYKFLLSVVIVILHSNYMFCPQGYLAVESFFIISGFFLAQYPSGMGGQSLKSAVFHRFLSVYPMYLMALILLSLADLSHGIFTLLQQFPIYLSTGWVLFIKSIGLNYVQSAGTLWFIPVYLHISFIFLFAIKRGWGLLFAVLCFLIGISSLVYSSPSGGVNYTIESFDFPIPIGYLRGIVSMSFGYLCAETMRAVSKWLVKLPVIATSLIEAVLLTYMVWILRMEPCVLYDFDYMITSGLFIICLFRNSGVISKCMNHIGANRVVSYVAGASSSIYFIHFLFVNEYCRATGGYVPLEHLPQMLLVIIIAGILMMQMDRAGKEKLRPYIKDA